MLNPSCSGTLHDGGCGRVSRSVLANTGMHGGCRDAVILQHQYEMPGSGVHYSVSDNLLVVHIGHSGRAQIIDVAGGGSAPVSAAQPFAMAPLGVRMVACVSCLLLICARWKCLWSFGHQGMQFALKVAMCDTRCHGLSFGADRARNT